MRKNVYVTPKSFLCLIDFYKVLYARASKGSDFRVYGWGTGLQGSKGFNREEAVKFGEGVACLEVILAT